MLQLSSSKDVDVLNITAGETKVLPPHSPAYEELVEVVTRAVTKLNFDWLTESQNACPKLDLHFLPSKVQPPCRGLPFFFF